MASGTDWIARAPARTSAVALAIAAAALAAAMAAQASPRVERRVGHYPIDGQSRAAWVAQMRAKGPVDPVSGRRYSGYTEWQVTWSWQSWPLGDGQCRIAYWDVAVDITITLPEWRGRVGAGSMLVSQWDRFLADLNVHEAVHAGHGEQAAAEIERMFQALPQRLPCNGSRRDIDRAAREIIADFRRRDREFDRRTRHGILP
ncbi:DUF922 domain-containing protein [Lysobacter maris]|uniref:DUF922 domain-containing protein n=2 Tax=Marilutibacter maris TaxID=1605891 RepID=A0A508B133_9GAMM|nr:DUF922 domain-containing protein [Lysobacter maris]